MAEKNLNIIILAAGEGTRMRSALPKVLHQLAGKTLLEHVVQTAQQLNPLSIYVVYGHQGTLVKKQLSHLDVCWVEQKEQKGTGHAVMQALTKIDAGDRVLVMYGDVPLIAYETLSHLIESDNKKQLSWLTAGVENPYGLGRIVRDKKGNPKAIVEEKDATEKQRQIREINSGICMIPRQYLKQWLSQLKPNNIQGEYYLTDIFGMAVKEKLPIRTVQPGATYEILGVNDHEQLSIVERIFQKNMASQLMKQGLRLADPQRFDLRGHVLFKTDVFIDVNVIIDGNVSLGKNVKIGANVILKNVVIGDDVTIEPNCVIEDALIENECCVGPFARIRPGTKLLKKSKVGNFVEVKKSILGEHSKANHLTYLGDTTVGKHVNIGAGTITCNYDGVQKHATIIEDEVFVGSSTQLVAPVKVGKGATIGAGSTITQDVPPGGLTLSRSKQTTIEDWKRPERKEKEE